MSDDLRGPDWTFHPTRTGGNEFSLESIQCAVLQDIRVELSRLNAVFACANFQAVPRILRAIRRNTTPAIPCQKHPRYTATRRPTAKCAACLRFFNAKGRKP